MSLKGITSCLGYQQITDVSASTALTIPSINGQKPTQATIICTAQAVRYRDDGTAPTATVGMPLPVNTVFHYDGNLSAIRFIEQTAGAVLNISYYA